MATIRIGSSTTSLSPLSSCSPWRALAGMSGRRSRPRSRTGSVEASAAPRIAAAATGRSSSHHPASAISAAQSSDPGPSNRSASVPCRLTSAMLSATASVKRTSARLKVATTRRGCRVEWDVEHTQAGRPDRRSEREKDRDLRQPAAFDQPGKQGGDYDDEADDDECGGE